VEDVALVPDLGVDVEALHLLRVEARAELRIGDDAQRLGHLTDEVGLEQPRRPVAVVLTDLTAAEDGSAEGSCRAPPRSRQQDVDAVPRLVEIEPAVAAV